MKKHTRLLIGFIIVSVIFIISISINEIAKNNIKTIAHSEENEDKKIL